MNFHVKSNCSLYSWISCLATLWNSKYIT